MMRLATSSSRVSGAEREFLGVGVLRVTAPS
jgi:hypothetical protein